MVVNHAETRTMLFTDLRGSTAQRVTLGDDLFDHLRRDHDRVLVEAVAKHGGCIVKSTGDGLHIAFGAASDAVACATAMQRAIDRLNRGKSASEHLSLAIGISAGDVVAETGDVHGTPVVEAARLCAAARGGQVLVAEVVRLLAGSRGAHSFEPLGETTLKGLTGSLVTCEVVWHPPAPPQIPMPVHFAPAVGEFVGREPERELLLRAFKEATTGARQFVVVVGEPGIGKSRLAREVATTMHEAGAVVLAGRSEENLGGPFQLWINVLAHLIEHLSDAEITEHIAAHGDEIARVVPEIWQRRVDLQIPTRSDADFERHRLFAAIAALLGTVAADSPLVLVLDDLQWADVPSLQLLRHLVRVAPPAHMLIIGTYRDADLDRSPLCDMLSDLRRDDLFDRIVLRGLSEDELGQFLLSRFGYSPSPEFVGTLVAETYGNPFFAGEVMAHLVESDLVGSFDGSSSPELTIDGIGMSAGVRDLLGRRLARLRRASIQALEAASVLGRAFDVTALVPLNQVLEDELLAHLENAVRAGLIREDPTHPGRYLFTHALVRQKLYGDLGTTRRVRLHWLAGVSLQASAAHDLDAVAYHLSEGVLAGDAVRAVDASLAAGTRAVEMSAFETAVDHFGNALAMLEQTGTTDGDRRYAALVGLGDAHVALSNVAGYTDAYLAAAEVARSQGRADRLARVALGIGTHALILRLAPETAALFDEAIEAVGPDDSIERSLLLSHRAFHRGVTPGVAEDRGREVEEAAAIATRIGDRSAAAEAIFARASAMRGSSRVDDTLELARALVEAAVELDDVRLQLHAHQIGAEANMQRGDVDGWKQAVDGLRSLARRPNGTYARPWCDLSTTIELIIEERCADAERHVAAIIDTWRAPPLVALCVRAQQWNLLQWRGEYQLAAEVVRPWLDSAGVALNMRTVLAWLHLADDPCAARAELDQLATEDFAEVGLQVAQRPHVLFTVSELCIRSGSTVHAPAVQRLLEPYSGQLLVGPVVLWVCQSADTQLARLASLLGQRDRADELFRRGIALEEHAGMKLLVSTSQLWFAEHLSRSESEADRAKALVLVDSCLAHFERTDFYLADFYLTEFARRLRNQSSGITLANNALR